METGSRLSKQLFKVKFLMSNQQLLFKQSHHQQSPNVWRMKLHKLKILKMHWIRTLYLVHLVHWQPRNVFKLRARFLLAIVISFCSIELENQSKYDVEPEDLESVADTNILPTYEEVQEAVEVKKEKKESLTRIVPPTEWNLKLGGRTKTLKAGAKLVPPIKLRLKDSDGAEIESAGFLDKTFEATVSIKSGAVTFDNDLTSQVINFDDNGDAVFDSIKFKLNNASRRKRSVNETESVRVRRNGDCGGEPCDGECVTVEIELTEPPLPIGGQEAGPYCVEAEDEEEQSEENNEEESSETPCQFVTLYGMNSIYCSSNNMDTSNSLLLTTLNSMRYV